MVYSSSPNICLFPSFVNKHFKDIPMKKYPLHIQILGGMALGLIFAMVNMKCNFPMGWTIHYIKPIGTLFLNSLKMVAIPLVFASLLVCVASVQNTASISRIGGKAMVIYMFTTLISGGIGVAITNLFKPGCLISEQTRTALLLSLIHI